MGDLGAVYLRELDLLLISLDSDVNKQTNLMIAQTKTYVRKQPDVYRASLQIAIICRPTPEGYGQFHLNVPGIQPQITRIDFLEV